MKNCCETIKLYFNIICMFEAEIICSVSIVRTKKSLLVCTKRKTNSHFFLFTIIVINVFFFLRPWKEIFFVSNIHKYQYRYFFVCSKFIDLILLLDCVVIISFIYRITNNFNLNRLLKYF